MDESLSKRLPDRIRKRLAEDEADAEALIANATALLTTPFPPRMAFSYQGMAFGGDLMSDFERAQSVSFVTRYEHLPADVKIHLGEKNGVWSINNFWVLRHVLNDFRPIIQNQGDAVYYQTVHNQWYQMLTRADPAEGMTIRVIGENEQDATPDFCKRLGENNRAIRHLVNALDFDYLYNGFLQHSDMRFSKRFFDDFISGELNYVLCKHVRPLGTITHLLSPYHRLMRTLTFPHLGNL